MALACLRANRWRYRDRSLATAGGEFAFGGSGMLGCSKEKDSDKGRSAQRTFPSTAGHDKRTYPSASSLELTPSL